MQRHIHTVSSVYEHIKKGLYVDIHVYNKLEKAEEQFQEIIDKFIKENGEEHIEYDYNTVDYVEIHSPQCKLTVENNYKIIE